MPHFLRRLRRLKVKTLMENQTSNKSRKVVAHLVTFPDGIDFRYFLPFLRLPEMVSLMLVNKDLNKKLDTCTTWSTIYRFVFQVKEGQNYWVDNKSFPIIPNIRLYDSWEQLKSYFQPVKIGEDKQTLASFLASSFQEHFKTPCTMATFTQYYPHLKPLQDTKKQKVWVENNRLYIDGCTPALSPCDVMLKRCFDFKDSPVYTIFLQVGRNDFSPGDWNVGLRLAQNNICFHPGLRNGAVRVEGPGGFGNRDFPTGTPDVDTFHTMRVVIFKNGIVHFWIYPNSQLPDDSNHWSFQRIRNSTGTFDVGFRREGGLTQMGDGIGFYSDLIVVPGFHRTPPPFFR